MLLEHTWIRPVPASLQLQEELLHSLCFSCRRRKPARDQATPGEDSLSILSLAQRLPAGARSRVTAYSAGADILLLFHEVLVGQSLPDTGQGPYKGALWLKRLRVRSSSHCARVFPRTRRPPCFMEESVWLAGICLTPKTKQQPDKGLFSPHHKTARDRQFVTYLHRHRVHLGFFLSSTSWLPSSINTSLCIFSFSPSSV